MPEEGLSMAEEIEWFVGIDWASQSHQVCLVDARGECLGERAVAHGGLGIEELCDWLIARTGATPEVIGVAIEMTHGPVVEALLERGFCVYGINPKQLDRFRDRFTVAGAKDDRRDAHVLGDSLHRSARLSASVKRRASDCAAARVVADGRRPAAGARSSGQPH